MRILCCLTRDLASNLALNVLLRTLVGHTIRVVLAEQVGRTPVDEPPQRRELRIAEQTWPNVALFPLVERAALGDSGNRNLTFTEIQRLRGISVEVVANLNSAAGVDLVNAFAPDLILSVRFGTVLKAPLIGIPPLGVLNFHSGILPAYRGILPTFRAMMNGDAEIGCTLHYIRDASIDTGDVVAIHRRPLLRERSLLKNVLDHYPAGIEMIRSALQILEQGGTLPSAAQQPGVAAYYSYPTAEEWDEFTHRGWRVADPTDLHEVMLSYIE
ncbi:MAG TPA: formyl transferase [Steroidobacteraceae bacterium]